jgi:hypothetical protein
VERAGTPGVAGVVAACSARVLAHAGSENFPVALRVLPRRSREHLLAVYGFARLVDDLGDEAPGDRSALLDWVESELDRAVGGGASDRVVARLAPTIRACSLPIEALHRLIEANRRDQVVTSYRSWDELREYCRYSADPIGRLVLAIFGVATPERMAWSDDVCTALQLVEHLQDVGEDDRVERERATASGRRVRGASGRRVVGFRGAAGGNAAGPYAPGDRGVRGRRPRRAGRDRRRAVRRAGDALSTPPLPYRASSPADRPFVVSGSS